MTTHLLGAQKPSCFCSACALDFVALHERPEGDLVEDLRVVRGYQRLSVRPVERTASVRLRELYGQMCGSNANERTAIDIIDGQNAKQMYSQGRV